jgi:hypothetical protein
LRLGPQIILEERISLAAVTSRESDGRSWSLTIVVADNLNVRALQKELAALVRLMCGNVLDAHQVLTGGDLSWHLEGELFLATQLVGSMQEATLRYVTEKRYNSLLPIPSRQFNSTQATDPSANEVFEKGENSRGQSNRAYQSSKPKPTYTKSLPNETRKRMESDEGSDKT